MIRIRLSTLLGERRWTQADLARLTGIRANTINELYHEVAVKWHKPKKGELKKQHKT